MKYSEAIDYLDSRIVLGVKPSLDRISALARLMDGPQDSYDAIQVAGTNGKTSVSRMISAILLRCGFRVGLFTSPHLETIRERISVGDKLISAKRFSETLAEIMPHVEKAEAKADEPLTYFEVVTAVAYRYFQSEGIDVAVLEAGMGGRWDATNLVVSKVAVITNIGIDHVEELGRTRTRIAGEKVGIVNEGAVLITAESSNNILRLISRKCREAGAEMKLFGRDFRLEFVIPYRVPEEPPSQLISVRGLDGKEFKDMKLPLIGKHQAVNAACAMAASQAYTDPLDRTDAEAFKRALESIRTPGRLEILSEKPLVVVDGAHNVSGAERLASTLIEEFDYKKLVIVVSILEDKDAKGIMRVLGAVATDLIVTENRNPRSIPAGRLGSLCGTEGIEHRVEPDFPSAMRLAYNIAGKNGLICVTGSLYSVSEARIYFKHQRASKEMRQDR
jgi:dihydrofolate synthase/folylpolyglutamate synthase